MFFSILISDLGVVVHSQWDDCTAQGKLRILTTRDAAQKLAAQLPEEEARSLAEHLPALQETGPEASVEVEGAAAISLISLIAKYYNNVGGYQHLPQAEELFGFWKPPEKGAPGEGIIMWSDLDVNYHVAIVHSKQQAEQLISTFGWLQPVRQAVLLGEIKQWNANQISSKNEQRIGGAPARLLCRASMVMKALG